MSNPDVSNLPSGTVAIEEIAPIQKGWGGVGWGKTVVLGALMGL